MASIRRYIPITLIIWIIVLLVLGAAAGPVIQSLATEQQMARNVLLSAIPFVLIFAAIVLTFIALIVTAANLLNHKIEARVHRPIEQVIIAGIILGALGMFQPWWFGGFRYGFFLLLLSTLAFILWSHITPKGFREHNDAGSVSVSEFEHREVA